MVFSCVVVERRSSKVLYRYKIKSNKLKMFLKRNGAFSPNNTYFAYYNLGEKLLVWETSSNTILMDCKFDSNVYGKCTALHWIPLHNNHHSPKKAKIALRNSKDHLLAVGTTEGDILLYNIATKNLYSHLRSRHSDVVTDIDFHNDTNSFFTCSSDKCIAVWDILSGNQKLKWTADDNPIFSICVLDGNNLLSSSSSILWWNVSEMSVIKKFEAHSTEVFKLLPVNAVSLKSCYFLSVANNDARINAWSVNNTQTPVVSFIPSSQPEDMDVSSCSSKDKPLILSVITEKGYCHFYEHTLNGNVEQPLHPKATVEIIPKRHDSESNTASVISTKLSNDSESCIVAYRNQDNLIFKHINIKELFKESENKNTVSNISSQDNLPLVKDSSKIVKKIPLNGLKSSRSSENSPKKKGDSVIKNSSKKISCSRISQSISQTSDISNETDPDAESLKRVFRNRNCIKDSDINNSDKSVSMFLRGLQTQNDDLIDAVLQSNDTESISNSVKYLPMPTLKVVLEELSKRLQCNQRYSYTVVKWLKEILRIHFNYLIQAKDTAETLGRIKELIQLKKTSETISKMTALKGLLNLHQMQNASCDESDSASEEAMES